MLKNAIPGFEFPRVILDDYIIETVEISPDLVTTADFVVGTTDLGLCLVERSFFTTKLTQEEINILEAEIESSDDTSASYETLK